MFRQVFVVVVLAVFSVGFASQESLAGIAYQNTIDATGTGYQFGGAAKVGIDLITTMDINEITLAPCAATGWLTTISFIANNFNDVPIQARALCTTWLANGPGGGPGTASFEFLMTATLAADSNTVLTLSTGGDPVPPNSTFWIGISFDNENYAYDTTAAQLDQLGAYAYRPATVGQDGSQAYSAPPGTIDDPFDPVLTPIGSAYGANFGWTVDYAVPEPSSWLLLAFGTILTFAFSRHNPGRAPIESRELSGFR
jgi:hypothetical protein